MSTSSARKIVLRSSDGESFEVEEAVALQSQTIKHMVEDDCADNGIPLPNVTSKILSKVIEYCNRHSDSPAAPAPDDDLKLWDAEFVKVDQATFYDLMKAADYLHIENLLYLGGLTILKRMMRPTILKMSTSTARKIVLRSSDGVSFEVEEAVALQSQTIKHVVEDDCADNGIPLLNVTSKILSKVIEYCNLHYYLKLWDAEFVEVDQATLSNLILVVIEHCIFHSDSSVAPAADDFLKLWDAKFVKVDQATLFDIILAANYLNIENLLDLTTGTVADMIKGKTPEEIRKTFNFRNELTPEEEEEVRRENQWAFE